MRPDPNFLARLKGVTIKITLQQWPEFLQNFNARKPVNIVDEEGVVHEQMAVTHYYQKGYGADFECEATYVKVNIADKQLFVHGKGDFR